MKVSAPEILPRQFKWNWGWYLSIKRADGKEEHVGGFQTKREAELWVVYQAAGWLSDHPKSLAGH